MKKILGMLLGAGLVAGCSIGGSPPGGDTGSEPVVHDREAILKPAWTTKLNVIGQPVLADGVAVVLARTGDDLWMHGLTASTGEQRWRLPYSPDDWFPGQSLAPVVTKDDSGQQYLVARDPEATSPPSLDLIHPRTGKVVSTWSTEGQFGPCSDGTDVCADGYPRYAWQGWPDGEYRLVGGSEPYRWNIDVTDHTDVDLIGGPDAGQGVSRDLYVGLIGTPRLVRADDGKPRWERRLTALFGPGATTDNGWAFDYLQGPDVYVGAVGTLPVPGAREAFAAGRPVTYDYRDAAQVVAIDGRDGSRLWRVRGGDPWCPLAGGDGLDEEEDTVAVVCVRRGRVTEQKGQPRKHRGLTVEIRGVEPHTGQTIWSHRLAGAAARKLVNNSFDVQSPGGPVLATRDGLALLDRGDGRLEEIDPGTTSFCSRGPLLLKGLDRRGGTLYHPCTVDGRRAKGGVSEWGVAALPATESGWRAVSLAGKVHGYHLPER